MQNFARSFSASKSSQFVNDRLGWDEGSPHRHDCHDPPHGARGGFVDDRSPPRRLPAVARSDPWEATRAQEGFLGDVTRRRRLSRVAGSYRWNTGTGGDCLRRDLHGEDCHHGQGIQSPAPLAAAKIDLGAFTVMYTPKDCFGSHGASCAEPDRTHREQKCFNDVFGHVEGISNPLCQISTFASGQRPGKGCVYAKDRSSRSTS